MAGNRPNDDGHSDFDVDDQLLGAQSRFIRSQDDVTPVEMICRPLAHPLLFQRQDMPHQKPQSIRKHPDPYLEDLNPDHMAGQNIGEGGPDSLDRAEYASERKDVMTALVEFNHDELEQIPLIRAGARLKNRATYLDVRIAGDKPFTVTGEMYAPEGRWIVPKADTPKELWRRLLARR